MKSNLAEYLPIIRKLLERTKQGRVQWEGGLGSFRCKIGSEGENALRFTLSVRSTPNINYDRRFLVMEDQKDELFRIESNDLPTSVEEDEASIMIDELYELARHQALKVDEKLEQASTLLDRV
jgi:hypothetical protein